MMRCAIRENKDMTLRRFCKGLNDNLKNEIRLKCAFTFDQFYIVVQYYEMVIKK